MNKKQQKAKELIEQAMVCLVDMPCGGIGKEGATQSELDECSADGHNYGDDAMYHQSQQAWLYLERAMRKLE